MKKILFLIIIVITILSVPKVEAQTLNWAKGKKEVFSMEYSWSNLSSDKKYFYMGSPQYSSGLTGLSSIYDIKSGNLIKKYISEVGFNRYLIDDSTFMYLSHAINDSVNTHQMFYDSVNTNAEDIRTRFSVPLVYKGKNYSYVYNDYKSFICKDYLVFTAKVENKWAFVFWDINNRCIKDVLEPDDTSLANNINSMYFDNLTNVLYFSYDDNLYQYDVSSRKVIKAFQITGAKDISLSSNRKFIALRYRDRNSLEFRIAIVSTENWKIIYQKKSEFSYFDVPTAISPNSNLIAYQNSNKQLEVYDVTTKKVTEYNVLFSPDYIEFIDDKQLVFSSELYGFTAIYDIEKKEQTKSLVVNETLSRKTIYSHNGDYIAVLGFYFLKILDAKTGNMINLFNLNYSYDPKSHYYSIDFSPNDDKIIFTHDSKDYMIFNLKNNSSRYISTNEQINSGAYSVEDNDIIAYSSSNGEVTLSYDDGRVIKKSSNVGFSARSVMYSKQDNFLYYITINPSNKQTQLYFWDYNNNILKKVNDLKFKFEGDKCYISTFNNRYYNSGNLVYDTKLRKMIETDSSNLSWGEYLDFSNISSDGEFSIYRKEVRDNYGCQYYFAIFENKNRLATKILHSIFSQDFIPYNSKINYAPRTGCPWESVLSPDNKTLIYSLDCGSIISLNIENLTPVKEDFVTVEGLKIVNVINKGTFLNCEIYSPDNLSDYDYYIYDLTGKLLNQGALGTIGQGTNNIIINYTKTMLYPAILMIKSKTDNSYQSKLFY